MADLQLYDKLLQFPLFLGMSGNDLAQVVAHTRFDFIKLGAGKRIVKAGEVCHHLHLLTDGIIRAETVSKDGAYRVVEEIEPPFVIQPERIFGVNQRFTTTFTTQSESHIIAIGKREVMALSEKFLVFRINLLALYATRTQTLIDEEWQSTSSSLSGHIVSFFKRHCLRKDGKKQFYILMQQLANEVNDSRTDVSRVLNEMQKEGVVSLSRGCITIDDMEKVLYRSTLLI